MHDDTSIQTARLTLLALRAAAPEDVPPVQGQERLSLRGTRVDKDEIVRRLAAEPKPLLVSGIAVDHVLHVDWRPLSSSPRDGHARPDLAPLWHDRRFQQLVTSRG